jgi:inorganic pyrophosphatase
MDKPTVRMIVDTPKDSRIKYKLEESSGNYIVSRKDGDAPQSLDQLPKDFVDNVERFFSTYHQAEGNQFKVLQLNDARQASRLIERSALTQNGRRSHRA